MSTKKPKSITVQGIEVEGVTPETFNDFDFLEIIAAMNNPDATDGETVCAVVGMGPFIFGKTQWKRIKAELREQNGGKLTTEIVMELLNGVMAEVKAVSE